MSAIRIRALLRRRRRHLALLSVVVALAGAIVVHHGVMAESGMGHGMGAVAQMCLGVFAAVGGAVVAIVIASLALGPRRPLIPALPSLPGVRRPIARARDGPALLVLLCVCRR